MCKRDYKVEDFVLDPEFQKWVLSPDTSAKTYWQNYVDENPGKHMDIVLARKLVLNMSRKARNVGKRRIEETWENIDLVLDKIQVEGPEEKVIPLDSFITLRNLGKEKQATYNKSMQLYRIAGILVISLLLSIMVQLFFQKPITEIEVLPITYEEYIAPPGLKSNLTLQDGSKVILNSGSSLTFIKNFESHQRVLELVGEAYFEVEKDNLRPFKVKTGSITTTALGTSFNIKAYENESLDIALVTGLVAVDFDLKPNQPINLEKGEGLQIDLHKDKVKKIFFDEHKVLAWTKKTILFEQTPMNEMKRILENWYGVDILFLNQPPANLLLTATFEDETLKNVLEGLKYTTDIEYTLSEKKVSVSFKK